MNNQTTAPAAATSSPAAAPTPRHRFFDRIDWSAFWFTFVAVLAGYCYTLAPTVTLEDSGELATAGAYLGIPHPPGYPIWTMIVWVFTKMFSFVTYLGQPNPAWAIGLASAVFGALASALTALLVCRSGRDFLRQSKLDLPVINNANEKLFCWVGGVSSSIVFAFTSINWSQAVIVEVYALNAFFMMLIMTLAYMWIQKPGHRLMIMLSFVFGLGLTNYQALLLMLPAIMILVMVKDLDLFRDFVIAALPFGLAIALMKLDLVSPVVHPLHYTGYIYLILNMTVLILIYYFLPRGKTVALSILFFELGLAVYGYMPLASDFNPPMNWGYPRTYEGFKHAISRGQYEKISPTAFFSWDYVRQMGDYLSDLRAQFTLPIAILGFIPLTILGIRVSGKNFRLAGMAVPVMILAWVFIMIEERLTTFSGEHAVTGGKVEALTFLYLLFISIIGVLLFFGFWTYLVDQGREFAKKIANFKENSTSDVTMSILILSGAGAVYLGWIFGLGRTFPKILQAFKQPDQASALGPAFGQMLGVILLIVVPIISILLVYWLMSRGTELKPEVEPDSRRWVIVILASYLVMSLMFVWLANPKGDIQDYFIQRVKYISSHAVFSIMIGYGMITALFYGLSTADLFSRNIVKISLKDNKVANMALSIFGAGFMIIVPPLVPVANNYFNREQIRIVGGAEMNGHDFGWQFGNYQLRGAEAIIEELGNDEEPLPNPEFPREMEKDAVFYGGTDPGRFVPTYMIYSADVRPDVFLITQNALADNTYMSVMRDLYGNQIWIPSPPDSANAFQRYVEETKSGKRPANAELKIENGRVQVSGALGVMEINGILAQMIFEKNNWRHAFYVEESYVIRWMYPYLEPHGLIMKIDREPNSLTDEIVRNDMDFWDWYTRRLVASEKFIRDIVARKSFSKLRSAIGGLYANRGRPFEAEKAFQQARVLYPLSPEANFRLAQEVLLPLGRAIEAVDLMMEFQAMDPGNKGVMGFVNQIKEFQSMTKKIGELEVKATSNKASIDEVLQLIELYLRSGNIGKFNALSGNLLATSNMPLPVMFKLGAMFQKAGKIQEMDKALEYCLARFPENTNPEAYIAGVRLYAMSNRPDKMRVWLAEYLKRRPLDWRAWFDMTTIEMGLGRTNDALKSLEQAFRAGGEEALSVAAQNPNFAPLYKKAAEKVQGSFSMPMTTPGPGPMMPPIGIPPPGGRPMTGP